MHTTAPLDTAYSPLTGVANALRSEYCKLRTVRSTTWALLTAVVANIGVAALLAIFVTGRLTPHEKATIDSIRLTMGGLHISQVAIGVLGVLVISGEYSTGTIRATLAAVPRRRIVLAAKTAVVTTVSVATGIDLSATALHIADRKAKDRGLTARFLRHDARDMAALGESFGTVLDCGLFHVLVDEGART